MKNPWNAECIKMRAKFDPIYSVEVSQPQKTLHPRTPGTKVSDMDPWRERYSTVLYTLKQICAFVMLSTGILAPDEWTEK